MKVRGYPPLTAEGLRQVVSYDPETGDFIAIIRRPPVEPGQPCGRIDSRGYRIVWIARRPYRAHRLAWLYMTGDWPQQEVDHKNLVKDDNRWANLRLATTAENQRNTGLRRDNTSGLKGACWIRSTGSWQSYIRVNGRQLHLGYFATKEEAHAAYVAAAREHFGEFARAA